MFQRMECTDDESNESFDSNDDHQSNDVKTEKVMNPNDDDNRSSNTETEKVMMLDNHQTNGIETEKVRYEFLILCFIDFFLNIFH